MKPLRPYQARAIADARAAYASGKRAILLVAPTGAGKTRIGTEIVSSALARGRRVLWLAHRAELLTQARDTLRAEGVTHLGVISAALPHLADPSAPVQVASVQTLGARDLAPHADVVVFDEAHHYVASEWLTFAERYAHATRLGLTATPVRSDGTPLGDLFDHLVVVASIAELTRQGYLVPCDVIAPPRALTGAIAQDPVDAWYQHARGQQTVVFARGVQHAREIRDAFRARGVQAAHVDGTTERVLRDRALDDFKRGHVQVLTNAQVLTEGFDAPTASCCLLARACSSLGAYLQIVGRVLRPAPGKSRATLLDLTGAVHRHGLPEDDREYSLDGEGVRSVKKPSLKTCLTCGATHAPAPVCPRCGTVYPVERPVLTVTGDDLRRVAFADLNDAHLREEFARLVQIADARGYKRGWAAYRFVAKHGRRPPRAWEAAS